MNDERHKDGKLLLFRVFRVFRRLHLRDTEGLPSVVTARERRPAHANTLKYYGDNYHMKPETIHHQFTEFGAGDCFGWFSFPGGHSCPPVARQITFAWYDRWSGREITK